MSSTVKNVAMVIAIIVLFDKYGSGIKSAVNRFLP